VLVAVVALVFLFVVVRSRQRAEYGEIQTRGYKLRTRFFVSLLVLGTPSLIATLVGGLPYAATHGDAGPAQMVDATAHQWYWTVSTDHVTVGTPVEFRVTSGDVNHSFALYDPQMRIVAETQAMPKYTNHLRYTFTQPGTYKVMCLEYCGLGHANMTFDIHVQSAGGKSDAT
ncbi:MAG TPA: hypothetical protein V6D47_14790, partial [Oscillatoriaceae cyanobacterium]